MLHTLFFPFLRVITFGNVAFRIFEVFALDRAGGLQGYGQQIKSEESFMERVISYVLVATDRPSLHRGIQFAAVSTTIDVRVVVELMPIRGSEYPYHYCSQPLCISILHHPGYLDGGNKVTHDADEVSCCSSWRQMIVVV